CVTGAVYLFKDDVNAIQYESVLFVEQIPPSSNQMPLSEQLSIAKLSTEREIKSVTLPEALNQTTAFQVKMPGRATNEIRVDPYSGEVTGQFEQKETLMFLIRKLHGELLLDTPGTLVVELVASWFLVLLITGVYLWWPSRGGKSGIFTIRIRSGKRTFWRDLHAVGGFWFSVGMIVILAGGMPWTDVFGDNLKWVQAQTDTGYPAHWRSSKGLASESSVNGQDALTMDQVANLEAVRQLKGKITITLPEGETGVYSVTNQSFWLKDQQVLHINRFTGIPIKHLDWSDVGVLMDLRQVFMRVHQGEYGLVNWLIVMTLAVLFTITTIASIVSYLIRKPKSHWGLPRTPKGFKVDAAVIGIIGFLGVLFPLFGLSVIVIAIGTILKSKRWQKRPIYP
ncbi:MAG: PepSY domain-containing protein, partial [Pseudomonadota bacterium]